MKAQRQVTSEVFDVFIDQLQARYRRHSGSYPKIVEHVDGLVSVHAIYRFTRHPPGVVPWNLATLKRLEEALDWYERDLAEAMSGKNKNH